ncbi:MAG: hypothetical protein HYY44_02750 [Deltaproteobacteria bacterium]|nr:hypothetical protein [Deltaproteobacteria bacterium]
MWNSFKKSLPWGMVGLIGVMITIAGLRLDAPLYGQTEGTGVDVGAQVDRSLSISLEGGTNPFGKKSFFTGNAIDFGQVTFTQPELVTSGDAYREKGRLRLEAILNVGVVFGGLNAVTLDLTRLKLAANSFRETYFSPSTNRSDPLTVVLQDPEKNRITTLTQEGTIPLRVVMEISPEQHGRFTDRSRLEANAQ